MNPLRILLLSNVRPSRAWKIANRITRESPDTEVCGIVQRPTQKLSFVQQLVAARNVRHAVFSAPLISRTYFLFQSALNGLLRAALWCIHGCPRNLPNVANFTTDKLAEACNQAGRPLLQTDNINDVAVADFVRQQEPEIAILLGELPLSPELLLVPTKGCIRVHQCPAPPDGRTSGQGTEIRIEHFAQGSDTAVTVARLSVPLQVYDGLAAHTLKTDLMADDLLLQTVISLKTNTVSQASAAVSGWIETILSPYLQQLTAMPTKTVPNTPRPRRHRPVWKLCFDTLLLCSPFVMGRNWYRRWCGRYPVLILTHHLVSDRPHRMGITTEIFWQQLRFLKTHYRIVSLSEAIELLRSDSVSAPTVVLTFDDGYADNFANLRAVAEDMEIPVSHFIVTQAVENRQEFEHDVVQGERGALPLTWDQIRYWNLRGAEFGSHTRTHFDCASTDRARLEQEIVGSRSDLEAHLGKPVTCFAFPFGNHQNMSSEAVEIAASAYEHFASGFGGDNVHNGAAGNRHLFRKNLYGHPWELELELQSIFDLVDRIKRRLRLRRVGCPGFLGRLSTALAATMSKNTNPESGVRVSN